MDKDTLKAQVLHLREVEGLSMRQIARQLGVCPKRIRRMLKESQAPALSQKPSIIEPYRHLIEAWYGDYPRLKAKQIYERLIAYGYRGSYRRLAELTEEYRRLKPEVYHPLIFLPGEEAQVDWFFFNHPRLGKVAGFLYVLAWSRYAWGKFYPKASFEFFLAGHLECFQHLKGLARRHRYDNLLCGVLHYVK